MRSIFSVFFFLLLVCGCIAGGTHGYIKAYIYKVPKPELERAVHQVITLNTAIRQDPQKDYYNDDTTYVTMVILNKRRPYSYTFRYYGNKPYWDTSRVSKVFIAYAYDDKRNGGSEGGGGLDKSDGKLIRQLTLPFEKEFISKIDSVLNIKHSKEQP